MRIAAFLTLALASLLPAAAHATYWNLFNVEGESALPSAYVTYATLIDMLDDTNRTGIYTPDTVGHASADVVGGGSDGRTYWNLFNREGESPRSVEYVTQATLSDMRNDTNRTGVYMPDAEGRGGFNVVGGGADILSDVPEPPVIGQLVVVGASLGLRRHRPRAR